MQILAGVLSASSGEVRVDGVNLASDASTAKARIGYLPEHPPLYADMSVDEFLRFAARLRGVEGSQLANQSPTPRTMWPRHVRPTNHQEPVKGYQQRVGIAQAIVHRPSSLSWTSLVPA